MQPFLSPRTNHNKACET